MKRPPVLRVAWPVVLLVAGFGAAAFAIAVLSAQIDSLRALRPCSAADPNRQGAACPLFR